MMRSRPRRGFTPANVLAAIAAIGLLFSLALPALQDAREAANAAQCQNNVRQMALGVQNHHDQRGDLPPMGMFSGGISWAGATMPYMEQMNLWRRLRMDMPYDVPPNNDVRHLRGPNAAFPFFYCPSRRQPPQYTDGYSVSDYAVPSVGVNETLDDPGLDDTWMQCHDLEKNRGPFLLVYQDQPEEWKKGDSFVDALRYRSKTSMASLTDGASNQIIFGEKALHPDLLGKPGKAGDFTCYAFIENDFNASGAARPGHGGISPAPTANKETVYRYWGSWHPGYCRFAMADGRAVKLNVEMSGKLLASLCNRGDGAKIKYPDDYRQPIDDSALVEAGE